MRRLLPALLLLAPLATGCLGSTNEPVDVMTTFYPLGYLAQRLGGDEIRVDTLVPAGVEPHDWEPTAKDLARLSQAKLLVVQGAGFEPWLDGMLATLGDRAPPVHVATQGLDLKEGEHAHADEHADEPADEHAEEHGEVHGGEHEGEADHAAEEGHDASNATEGSLDPHTWLDPVLFAAQAHALADAMARQFPDHAHAIHERAEAIEADLAQLHLEYEQALADCETDVVIANHDAYGYLERRYGFQVEAVSGLTPEAEPSPRDMKRVIDAAREHNVTVIFFEELVSPNVAQAIAREVGATTKVLSPIEGLSAEARAQGSDYISLMRQNLVNLQEAMRCTPVAPPS